MARILLAADGSPSSLAATREAVALAHATAWSLAIVTVWHLPVTGFGYEPLALVPDVSDEVRAQAQAALDDACAIARAAGVEPQALLAEGAPDAEICAAAERTGATLIVIGSHGFGPVQRLLFGSVSTAVLHHAPCPVLVVRDPAAAA